MTRRVKIELPSMHDGQLKIWEEKKRFNVACMGRRWGKSKFGINIAIEEALKGNPVGWFAPTYKILMDAWRQIKSAAKPVISRKSEHEKMIELVTGGSIEMWTLDTSDPARSRHYSLSIIDEAAMVKNLNDAWNMAIMPTLMDLQGSGWFLSSPKGGNDFSKMFYTGQNKDDDEWISWQLPTSTNPFIKKSEIEGARKRLPALVYQQEILAEIVDYKGNLIKRSQILYSDNFEDGTISIGVDLAISEKSTSDYTAIVVCKMSRSGKVYVVHVERMRTKFYDTLQAIIKCSERFNPSIIKIESNQFQAAVVQELVRTTSLPISPARIDNKDKVTRFRQIQVKYEQNTKGSGLILHSSSLIPEFEHELLSFPPQSRVDHDDMVDALVFAHQGLYEANNKPVTSSRRKSSVNYGFKM